ncbi:MAG: RidA family protein [Phycisphaeraceae bacterium]
MKLNEKLQAMGLSLPDPPKALAAYVPAVRTGNLIVISGQLPMLEGNLTVAGKVPSQVSLDDARLAARQCVLNMLAVLGPVIDQDWTRIRRVVRLGVFVASDPAFTEQHLVANGASEFLVKLFGDIGRHARAAVGVPSLPLNAPVEVEGLFEVG